ncbi:hypothetical protein ABIC16_000355 [Sphingomonas sp. PvP055]
MLRPHPDRVGRDQIIDLARLEHRDLCVAGARGQRAHHHRSTPAQAPQHLGNRVHFLRAECDDRGALRKAADLLRAGIAERREARAVDDLDSGDQRLQHRTQRFGPEQHRLLAATGAQDAVGEDVTPFQIAAKLRFIDANEC